MTTRFLVRAFAALLFTGSLAMTPALRASTVAAWDFENSFVGQVSGIAASTGSAPVASATFNTGNNGVEDFGGSVGKLSLTRTFGNSVYPSLTFTLSSAIDLTSISFAQFHNNNPGFPSFPAYNFDVQINDGSGWINLATGLVASSATNGTTDIIAGPGVLGAGTYSIRWVGYNFSSGNNSGSEYFGLNDVTLAGAVPEDTASLALAALGMSLMVLARRRLARG